MKVSEATRLAIFIAIAFVAVGVNGINKNFPKKAKQPDVTADIGKWIEVAKSSGVDITKLLGSRGHMPSELRKKLKTSYPGAFDETDPEADLPTPALIEYRGYGAAIYNVTTEDGYILQLHRITWSPKSPQADGKPVILLQHGLLCSSADWLLIPTETSLGFMLADAGYDVWLGNARGNTYSTNHVSYDTKSYEFWDFSWDEMGEYDIPAVINFILTETSQEDMFYVGHSMGTSMFYVAMSVHPELNQYIKAQFSLAPVAYTANIESPIIYLSPFANILDSLLKDFGIYHLFSNTGPLTGIARWFCDLLQFDEAVCANAVFFICGFDASQFNDSMMPILLGHTPADISVNTLVHYAQGYDNGRFCFYDFGNRKNKQVYGQKSPPDFEISEITAPIYLMWGQNDWLGDPTDVAHLAPQLPNVIENFEVPYAEWNHMDFLYGIDAHTYVYDYILQWLQDY